MEEFLKDMTNVSRIDDDFPEEDLVIFVSQHMSSLND